MAGLPMIQYPDVVGGGMNAFDWGRKARAEDDNRNAFREAGGALAQGNIKGARDTLYKSGNLDGGLKLQGRLDALNDKQREAAKRMTAVIAQGAMLADTPEKWATLVAGMKARGIPNVDKYADFNMRELAIAENGEAAAYLERADKLRKEKADADKLTFDQDAKLEELQLNRDKFVHDSEKPDYMAVDKRVFNKRDGTYLPRPADEAADPDGDLPEEVRKAFATKDALAATEYNDASQKAGEVKQSLANIRAQRNKTNWETPGWQIGRGISNWTGGPGFVLPDSADRAALDAMDAEGAKLVQSAASALKGTLSDRDLELLQSSVPGSGMSDEAAAPVMAGIEAGTIRAQARSEFYDEWIRANKSGRGFNEAWNRFINEKPLLSQDKNSGQMVVNPQNATAWREYLTSPAKRGAAPAAAPAKQYQPLPEGGFAATKRPAPGEAPAAPAPIERPAANNVKDLSDDDLWGVVLGGRK